MVCIFGNKGQNIFVYKSIVLLVTSFSNGGDYDSKQCTTSIIPMAYSCSKSFQWTMIEVRGAWFSVEQVSIPP